MRADGWSLSQHSACQCLQGAGAQRMMCSATTMRRRCHLIVLTTVRRRVEGTHPRRDRLVCRAVHGEGRGERTVPVQPAAVARAPAAVRAAGAAQARRCSAAPGPLMLGSHPNPHPTAPSTRARRQWTSTGAALQRCSRAAGARSGDRGFPAASNPVRLRCPLSQWRRSFGHIASGPHSIRTSWHECGPHSPPNGRISVDSALRSHCQLAGSQLLA